MISHSKRSMLPRALCSSHSVASISLTLMLREGSGQSLWAYWREQGSTLYKHWSCIGNKATVRNRYEAVPVSLTQLYTVHWLVVAGRM